MLNCSPRKQRPGTPEPKPTGRIHPDCPHPGGQEQRLKKGTPLWKEWTKEGRGRGFEPAASGSGLVLLEDGFQFAVLDVGCDLLLEALDIGTVPDGQDLALLAEDGDGGGLGAFRLPVDEVGEDLRPAADLRPAGVDGAGLAALQVGTGRVAGQDHAPAGPPVVEGRPLLVKLPALHHEWRLAVRGQPLAGRGVDPGKGKEGGLLRAKRDLEEDLAQVGAGAGAAQGAAARAAKQAVDGLQLPGHHLLGHPQVNGLQGRQRLRVGIEDRIAGRGRLFQGLEFGQQVQVGGQGRGRLLIADHGVDGLVQFGHHLVDGGEGSGQKEDLHQPDQGEDRLGQPLKTRLKLRRIHGS